MAIIVSQNGNSNGSQAATAVVGGPATIKDLLAGPKAAVLFGVHNALGAKIAEEAGADGLWISSFELHAAHRLTDADILGTQDYVSVVQQIVDRVAIPVFVDGNAGGGNAINTIRLVREFEKAGASGMCIEDNPFPKRCSFYDGMQQDLELEGTFCGKLQACIEKRTDEGFAVVARTEALIKDLGMQTALDRTKAYAAAGAEGILIHHNGSDPAPVLEFADLWYRTEDVPLVCVPTTYNTVTYHELDSAGFKLVIFANYGVRAIVKALQNTFEVVMAHKRLGDADEHVVPMEEVFRLIYVDELKENEARYVR
jgi:phosphoenolpyruvate phosphomutase